MLKQWLNVVIAHNGFVCQKKFTTKKNAISYLQELPHVHKAFIVADPGMVKFGFR